jgi:hypothetical protein
VSRDQHALAELFSHRWVRLPEEDTSEGAVYRPDDADLPLSRRPREQMELSADGSARVFTPGPDDRLGTEAGRWTDDGSSIVVRAGSREVHILRWSDDRLLVRR